jgi:hypothetical protein
VSVLCHYPFPIHAFVMMFRRCYIDFT